MALGYLFILFMTIIVISGVLVTLLYLLRNKRAKNILFYILAIWSILITFLNFTSLPSNYLFEQFIALILGSLTIISIFIKIKNPKKTNIAYFFVTASTILGLIDLIIF